MRRLSIPRWLLIAMAALLVIAIFVIVVHPGYNVSKATIGDSLTTLMLALTLALLQTIVGGAARSLVGQPAFLATRPQLQPFPSVERNCIRRI